MGHHGICTDLVKVNLSGGLKGAEGVLCAGGKVTESQDESHHWVGISTLLSLVMLMLMVNVKAREVWSADISPG